MRDVGRKTLRPECVTPTWCPQLRSHSIRRGVCHQYRSGSYCLGLLGTVNSLPRAQLSFRLSRLAKLGGVLTRSLSLTGRLGHSEVFGSDRPVLAPDG